jgi:non-specific serine/threonine protein kinase
MCAESVPGADGGISVRLSTGPERFDFPAIPVPATPLVDREREMADVGSLLESRLSRLVTLSGAGGIGKTRLALAVAHQVSSRTAVAFVSLETTSDPAMIPTTMIRRLGITPAPDISPEDALRDIFCATPCLLVLDNLEHLVPEVDLIQDLLRSCPDMDVLATSRVPLDLPGEHVFALRPLSVPETGHSWASDGFADIGSVRLFVERARLAYPAFELTRENHEAVISICRQLEGVPLAIELAAAWTRLLSPQSLAGRLEHSLPLLAGGDERPSRQRTMRAAIAWSVDLLPDGLRRVWELLGVFSGGFTVDAAETLLAACGPAGLDVLEAVDTLVEQNLLVSATNANNEPRFRMLETTREYALECLEARDAIGAARSAHARFFRAFARAVEPGLKGSDGWPWFYRVEADIPNIRLALQWHRQNSDIEAALEIACCLEWFWTAPGNLPEGRSLYESLLHMAEADVPAMVRGKAWMALGDLADWQGDTARAVEALHHALVAARESGDPQLTAGVLRSLGSVTIDLGRLDEAGRLLLEAYTLARDSGDTWNAAAAANLTGFVDRWRGDLDRARVWHETALAIWQQMGDRDHMPIALVGLGRVWSDSYEDQRALETLDAALALTKDDEDDYDTSTALDGVATIAARHGQYVVAARLLAVASRQRQVIGTPLRPVMQQDVERVLAGIREALGMAAFTVAWTEGQAMSAPEAKRLAREVTVPEPSPPDGLSAREREVLALLVEGASDNEIADRLFITRRTASKHVASILEKLDASNRTAAATIAHRRGLV